MKLLKDFGMAFNRLVLADGYRDRVEAEQSMLCQAKATRAYRVSCTGDCCVGDEVLFVRDIWDGSYRKPKHAGYQIVTGDIVKDSYGEKKQQHTFTIISDNGEQLLIKGRNLYKYGTWRKVWKDEAKRQAVLDEKHGRGQVARVVRQARRFDDEF